MSMTLKVMTCTLFLVVITEKLLVLPLILLCSGKETHEDQALAWSRRGKMCVFTLFLCALNNTVPPFRGEIAGGTSISLTFIGGALHQKARAVV